MGSETTALQESGAGAGGGQGHRVFQGEAGNVEFEGKSPNFQKLEPIQPLEKVGGPNQTRLWARISLQEPTL